MITSGADPPPWHRDFREVKRDEIGELAIIRFENRLMAAGCDDLAISDFHFLVARHGQNADATRLGQSPPRARVQAVLAYYCTPSICASACC